MQMIETLVCVGAVLLALICAVVGARGGAAPALRKMLCTVLALLVALRAWYPVALYFSGFEITTMPMLACLVFWLLFALVWLGVVKVCDMYFELYDAVESSLLNRLLGGICGLVSGLVLAGCALMTLALVAPEYLPAYHRETLPGAADTRVLNFFRELEVTLAHVPSTAPEHTLLPDLREATNSDPAKFWQ